MKSLFLILLYLHIMQTENSAEDDILHFGDEQGYCTRMVSRRESQRVSYLETYRERTWGIFYKTKYRWNYRTTYHTAWDIEERCCFLYVKRDDRCEPICHRDCGNGLCIRPNICSCNYGYTKSLISDGPICVAHCKNPCVNGQCTAPNVCVCDEGYSLNDEGICKPVCSEGCHMGICIAPGACMCNDGYGFSNDSTSVCVPICPKACINGFCVGPNVCECHDGFEVTGDETSLHICKPSCSIPCEPEGDCTAPNVCTCHEGYSYVGANDGFILFDGRSVCKPICEQNCVNGFCGAPGKCECFNGYELTDDNYICKPICEPSCWPHSTCTEPYTCTCDQGYVLQVESNKNTNTCEPICEKECINGFCSAPGECSCDSGYERFNETEGNVCKAICKPSCRTHSHCIKPDVCICDEGYESSVEEDKSGNFCEPICKKECVNGFCSSPGECSCNPGYIEIEANVCKPVCDSGCWPFSSCTAPGVCTCNEGYNLITDQNNSSKCEPICRFACPSNSICESPGLCLCKEGYRSIRDNEYTICEPICEFSCNNGTCSAPNNCTCELGYVNDENGSCIPHCTIGCDNGTCIEPDVCSCDEGYALVNGSSTCEPYCENNCNNGDCVAPNDCRCHVGFFKNGNESDSICVSACKDGCNEKGNCIDDRGNCDCYFGWSGTICEEPTVCVVVLSEDHRIYETLSLVKKPNYSMIFASASNPTCQQCSNEINNQTICYESLDDNIGERNYSAICFVDASSMCYATHSPMKEVLKVSVAVGGVAVLIMITSIAAACLKFKKNKKTVGIDKLSKDETSNENLLSEDSTNL